MCYVCEELKEAIQEVRFLEREKEQLGCGKRVPKSSPERLAYFQRHYQQNRERKLAQAHARHATRRQEATV